MTQSRRAISHMQGDSDVVEIGGGSVRFLKSFNSDEEAQAWIDANPATGDQKGIVKMAKFDTSAVREPASNSDRVYPCEECGRLRSKDEGGTTFTVCDECWDKHFGKKSQ